MNTMAAQPATPPIPVQLSAPEFEAFLLPHLSMPKRGPKCKLGYYRVFNLILWVLYTGMQWKCLPVPHDAQGKPAIHYTTIYNFSRSIYTTIRYKAKSHQDIGVPGLRGVQHGSSLNAPCA